MSTAHRDTPKPVNNEAVADRVALDRRLDAALEDSFPASDPIALSRRD